jgi:hypothetical protein
MADRTSAPAALAGTPGRAETSRHLGTYRRLPSLFDLADRGCRSAVSFAARIASGGKGSGPRVLAPAARGE